MASDLPSGQAPAPWTSASGGGPPRSARDAQPPEARARLSANGRGGGRAPRVDWPWWTAFAALLGGFALAAVGGLILVAIPAAALGVRYSGSHVPGGVELAATAVQDLAFVGAAVMLAAVGGGVVRAYQFGLRRPRLGVWRLAGTMIAAYGGFLVFSYAWTAALNVTEKEKLLESLGTNDSTTLLALSAALTCVLVPICEEFLFRGFFFRALSNWRGPWPAALITGVVFGAVHAGSGAPTADLVPLGVLGFGLCWLYRESGSLYPCIAVHSLNNCLAFGSLENWGWQIPVLLAGALGLLACTWAALSVTGVVGREPAA